MDKGSFEIKQERKSKTFVMFSDGSTTNLECFISSIFQDSSSPPPKSRVENVDSNSSREYG